MERKWVVAAFLDVNGFRAWTSRAATSPEIKAKFIEDFYQVLQDYVKKHHGPWSKYEGDGILTVREFAPLERKERRSVAKFVLELRELLRKAKKMLRDSETPPDGVRIRIMDGYVYKLMVLDPNDPLRKRLIPEYLEYCINTARGLLEVNPEIPCLATAGLVKNLGKAGSVFRVRPLESPSCYPKGVNREDVDGLHILKF